MILGLYVLTTVLQAPRYLSYFNVLIGRRLNAYRYLADSNLDWGQDLFALWAWERRHAGQLYVLEPYFPARGLVIVRANDFLGINDADAYAWLRELAPPVAAIGDSYLVFDLRDSDPNRRGAAVTMMRPISSSQFERNSLSRARTAPCAKRPSVAA